MYQQVFDPIADSIGASTIFAALPLLTFFVLLGALRMKAHVSALASLGVAVVIAIWVYGMPVGQTVLAATEGASFGFFPILWVVINAIWVYTLTVDTGHFDVLRRSFASVSTDRRIQAVIIAFCFGALLEALAGFGAPVAITAVMLIALGFEPMKAAMLALVANTAPVAFGAIATPVITAAQLTGIPLDVVGGTVGRQTPVLALIVPLLLVYLVDGWRGVRETKVPAIVCGVAFAIAQFVCSNYLSVELTDIVASLFSALVLVGLLRFWRPVTTEPVTGGSNDGEPVPVGTGYTVTAPTQTATEAKQDTAADTRADIVRAYAPYAIIIVVFAVAQITAIKTFLTRHATPRFRWPGLHVVNPNGGAVSSATFTFNYVATAGSLMLLSGIVTMLVLRISPRTAVMSYGKVLYQLRWAILTVMTVLALAYVMNLSGQTNTIGLWIAGAGGLFAFLSPVLGWLGVAVTGSDTSSNALFSTLQVTAATGAGIDPPVLAAAANASGGVLGKMISPQNLAIACAAVGLNGREGDLFRRVLGYSLGMLLCMCVLVYLQSTAVLSWMVGS